MIAARRARSAFVRALNSGGRTLLRGGIPLVRLEAAQLLEAAGRRTGLDDFGDEAFREPFGRLVRALDGEARLNLVGRIAARQDLLRLLSNRLRMINDAKRHPGILDEPIRRPIFVTGLPRTGTTLLHGLLAQDPSSRAPLTWEMMFPSPPPRRRPGQRDRRAALAERQIRWFHRLSPEFRAIHPTGAELPEECLVIASHAFMSFQFQTMYDVPSYESWLEQQDLRPAYHWHRRFLQQLQWRSPAARWVLKAPAHLFGFAALLDAYPDAAIVLTHRAPLEVVGSLASLTTVLRSTFSDDVDPFTVGAEMTLRWSAALFGALRLRDAGRVAPERIVDVLYPELTRDPIGVVDAIYRAFGLDLTAEVEARMRAFLAANPKDKSGRHRYTLGEFGLDAREEARRYARYTERFGL
ncbi:MAG: sulfotransferase [Thermodesulfobacteriota bacterium]